jgi:cytochrome c oxidase assembly protein subunit 15
MRARPTIPTIPPRLALAQRRLTITPRQFTRLAWVALAALSLIVLTGAAVRLTDSGLGCPTWPRCYGHLYPPLALHPLIEFGNRALAGLVGVVSALTLLGALARRPFRRDLAWLAVALPLGVIAQAVLGGYTVREKLAPGFVMSHFLLSMVILIAAVALVWRSLHEPGSRPRSTDRPLVWSVRALLPLCALTIVAGTAATAAGPHSGGLVGQHVVRLTIEGKDTLSWAVHQHATIAAIFGVAVIFVWLLKRKRTGGPLDPLEPLTVLGVLLAAQGLVGSVQYELHLPGEMVWIHVGLATVTWLVTLWAVAVEGRLAPRTAPAAAQLRAAPERRSLESVGS